MRIAAIVFVGALALAASAVSASAAPAVPDLGTSAGSPNIVDVAGGCGRWAHPNRWGHCVPNGYGYGYRHWENRYYGGGYDRPWRNHYRYGY
jgi:hypothetical protein